MKAYLYFFFFAAFLYTGCQSLPDHNALYEAVKRKYKDTHKKQQLESACFLLENMGGKAAVQPVLRKEGQPDVMPTDSHYLPLIRQMSTPMGKAVGGWTVIYEQRPDSSNITSQQLISNIEDAYQARYYYPWARRIDQRNFDEYVLPYRIADERMEDWRKYFLQRYMLLGRSLPANFNTNTVYRFIEQDVRNLFRFDKDYRPVIGSLALSQALDLGRGDCQSVAQLLVCALRAVGVPAAIELAPLWGKADLGHAELVYYDSTGTLRPPDPERFRHLAAKVFRKMYSLQPNPADSIREMGVPLADIPAFFDHDDLMDITDQRTTTATVRLPFHPLGSDEKAGYLCVYNEGAWKPIAWGPVTGDAIHFDKMGTGILYHAAAYRDGEVFLRGAPFFLEPGGRCRPACMPEVRSATILRLRSTGRDEWLTVKAGHCYQLSCWDMKNGHWKKLGTCECRQDGLVVFAAIGGQLYKLQEEGNNNQSRPFTYHSGKQEWW